jgi:hypothetical protein
LPLAKKFLEGRFVMIIALGHGDILSTFLDRNKPF